MSSTKSILSTLTGILGRMLAKEDPKRPSRPRHPDAVLRPEGRAAAREDDSAAGRIPGAETRRVDPERVRDVRVGYSPSRNSLPDSGEVVWTWVPYEENDGRGKDRPVLVIGRQSADRVYAVRMTSRPHDGDRDYLAIGSGDWDSRGRESWVDIEQLYSVHHEGMRREAAVLERDRYGLVADALIHRYGWAQA
ncbi:type II toxin-antitoxin system PemK/MazF family toxin [Microbacterium sp.]|uniref:type II toxin-antitoxin system PemK/MazF family toxin n=1 Tax=Microbacterium sp. TaxID=51671 RepID=UPI0028115D07|nr:type II toxin-antitoxin system PemK/MazF family toxin [Microbacterium sp.]